jgi:hypothetical protein
MCNKFLFNLAALEIMWKNVVERGRAQITTWRLRIACRIPRAINTHTGFVILTAFPVQHRLHVIRTLPVLLNNSQCFVTKVHHTTKNLSYRIAIWSTFVTKQPDITVFCDVMRGSLIDIYFFLKIKVVWTSKMQVLINSSTQCYVPEEWSAHLSTVKPRYNDIGLYDSLSIS